MKSVKRTTRFWVLTSLAGVVILTYLFATAPRPLETRSETEKTLSTQEALTLLAHENDVTRTLFTKSIVGGGKKNGLRFDEKWEETDDIAGPLPAHFLRGVADDLSRSDVPLRLFLIGLSHRKEQQTRRRTGPSSSKPCVRTSSPSIS